jgi:hypothetical protein
MSTLNYSDGPSFSDEEIKPMIRKALSELPFANELDLDTLEPVRGLCLDRVSRQPSDAITWRSSVNGQWEYTIVIVQRKPAWDMPVIVLDAVLKLYHKLMRDNVITAKDETLPPVHPVVVYLGQEPWTAPASLYELLEAHAPELKQDLADARYQLIEINRSSYKHLRIMLIELLRLELCTSLGSLSVELSRLVELLERPEHSHAREAFVFWIKDSLLPRQYPQLVGLEGESLEEIVAGVARAASEIVVPGFTSRTTMPSN